MKSTVQPNYAGVRANNNLLTHCQLMALQCSSNLINTVTLCWVHLDLGWVTEQACSQPPKLTESVEYQKEPLNYI